MKNERTILLGCRRSGMDTLEMRRVWEIIKKGKEYLMYASPRGAVHILPNKILREIKQEARMDAVNEVFDLLENKMQRSHKECVVPVACIGYQQAKEDVLLLINQLKKNIT